MEQRERKLGAHIAALRKSKGMTQEQLAAAVGVSPPAVSKWETDTSCPDIGLLCPLARALGINVDTLLQFEETLPEETLLKHVNEIVETARTQGCGAAEEMLNMLVHTYPSSISLKHYAAALLLTFQIMFPPMESAEKKKEEWEKQRISLLEQIRAGGVSPYWQDAVLQLASSAVQAGKLTKAEQLLKELPEPGADPTLSWVRLYLKRGEAEKAREVTRKRLFVLVEQIQSCLLSMMDREIEPDAAKALEICRVYKKMEDIFCGGAGNSEGLFAEIYQRGGETEKARDSMIRFVEAAVGTMPKPNPLLFPQAGKAEEKRPAASKEMRRILLQGLLEDDFFAQFREDTDFKAALDKLKRSVQDGIDHI